MWGVVTDWPRRRRSPGILANLFTLTSDLFPAQAVGSVVGIGGMAGAIGGMVMAKIVGYVLQWTGSYKIPFLITDSAYLLALALAICSPHVWSLSGSLAVFDRRYGRRSILCFTPSN
jgi:nitrate/nitrite transporter NarK